MRSVVTILHDSGRRLPKERRLRNYNQAAMKTLSTSLASAALLLSAHSVLGGRGHKNEQDAHSLLQERTPSEHKTKSAATNSNLSLRGGRALGHCDVYDPDGECKCLNGVYCGGNEGSTGLDPGMFEPNTLYGCDEGCYTVREHCGQHEVCYFEPCQIDDYCTDAPPPSSGCPGGIDGWYCGNNPNVPSDLVDQRLYWCEDGHYTRHDSCWNNHPAEICLVNVSGGQDECVDPTTICPDGKDGYYCGNNPQVPSDLVDGRLYECKDGHYEKVDTCTNNPTHLPPPDENQICLVNGAGGHDECVDPTPTCPNGKDGYYCGNNPHVPDDLVDDRLYECKDGHYERVDSCWNNHPVQVCKVYGGGHDDCVDAHPAPAPPPPSSACPGNKDGYYCGNNGHVPADEHLSDDVLYYCKDGHYSKVDTCTNNHPFQVCKVQGGGHDECVDAHPSPAPPPPSPECPGGKDTGKFCGNNDLVPSHLEDGVLYTCDNGHYERYIDCKDLIPAHSSIPAYFCSVSSSNGDDTCKLALPPTPTASPSAKPSAFCDNDDNKNVCPATPPSSPSFPECVGSGNGLTARCREYTDKDKNTAQCFEATELLLNTKNGSMETIMAQAQKFMYGVYCGDGNGCVESAECCTPPDPCDKDDDNGIDQSCKINKDCEALAGHDYTKLLQCEASFVKDLQHAYVDSLDNGEPILNGFCDEEWYGTKFTVTMDQGDLETTGAKFFKHESILNAFSPCCSPYGVRQCLGSGGSVVNECKDDNVLCFCKSIAEKFAYLGGDYATCANSYKNVGCSHVSNDVIPFPIH